MKHIITTTLLLLALLLPTHTLAHDFEVDGIYYNINGTNATVTYQGSSYNQYSNEYSGSVTIPATVTYNGTTYSVTTIGNSAFYNCTSLTTVNIPNSVTSIGDNSFQDCSSLTTVNIPNSVTNIGNYAFQGCSSLATISVASDNQNYDSRNNCNAIIETSTNTLITGCKNTTIPNTVTSIGDGAFAYCTSLTNINIPNSVTTIGQEAFCNCTSLTSINIPNSVTAIGYYAFHGTAWFDNQSDGVVYAGLVAYKYKGTMPEGTSITLKDGTTGIAGLAFFGCHRLTNINIPNSVTTIGQEAFCECSLTNIIIPNSVTSIGYKAFSYCSSLATINIPNSVTTIGDAAFEFCSSLININIPNSVTNIGDWAFEGCTSLTTVNIPNSVSSIGEMTFYNCSSLTTVNIPNSVTTIYGGVFEDCYSLNNVYCYATTPPECIDYYGHPFFSNYSATLHVPATSLAAYFTAPEWSNFENIVGDAIEPTGITISKDSVEIQSGEQFELTATVTPANASCKDVIWYSTDTSIATVEDGVVSAVGYGECDIFAYCMGMPAVCHITVANRISLGQQEAMLLPNHMLTLTPSAPTMPSGFTATSSDPTVAAVRLMSGKVQIVGIKEGTTTITVASTDGTAQPATCLVTVYTELCDVNCDGFITIGDATQMIDYLLGGAVDNFKVANADVNGDGQISIGDVIALIDQLLSANN